MEAQDDPDSNPRQGFICICGTGTLLGLIPVFKFLLNREVSSEAIVLLAPLSILLWECWE